MPNCKSCGASIRWVKTEAGKSMPIDDKPNPAGNIVIENGVATVRTDKPANTRLYISHFATCVNAAKHRKVD
ncbi:MAG: hypothetical protein HQM09_15125 [Candidatus Riflebacteria bacterium]|nr:hypothetical protein [Candidatus Riflebacteria bacterium]